MADLAPFPAFVIARAIDAGMHITVNTPLSVVGVPVRGRRESCLAWFTTREFAEEYARAEGLKASVVAINNAAEAYALLLPRDHFGVAVNPDRANESPEVYPMVAFTNQFRP